MPDLPDELVEVSCHCLNVILRQCRVQEGKGEKEHDLSTELRAALGDDRASLCRLDTFRIEHACLVSCTARHTKGKEKGTAYVFKCLNCSDFLLCTRDVDEAGNPSKDALALINQCLLSGRDIARLRESPQLSSTFNVIIEQLPPLSPSASTKSKADTLQFASTSGSGIEAFNQRITSRLSAARTENERQISALRKQFDDFRNQLYREAAHLAVKAGVQRGFSAGHFKDGETSMSLPSHLSTSAGTGSVPTSPFRNELGLVSPSPARPSPIQLRRSSAQAITTYASLTSPTLASASPSANLNLDLASSLKISEIDKLRAQAIEQARRAQARSKGVSDSKGKEKENDSHSVSNKDEVKSEEEARATPPLSSPQTPGSSKRVKFAEVDSEGEATDTSKRWSGVHAAVDEGSEDVAFPLDEEIARPGEDEENATPLEEQYDVTEDMSFVPRSPATPSVSVPTPQDSGKSSPETKRKSGNQDNTASSPLSKENKEQIKRLRELLGTDAPSHREHLSTLIKSRTARHRFSSDGTDEEAAENTTDDEAEGLDMARSLPIAIAQPHYSRHTGFQHKTSLPNNNEALFVPGLISNNRVSNSISGVMSATPLHPSTQEEESSHPSNEQIAAELRQATMLAASMSMSMAHGQGQGSQTVNGAGSEYHSHNTNHRRPQSSSSTAPGVRPIAVAPAKPNLDNAELFSPPKSGSLRQQRQMSSSLTASLSNPLTERQERQNLERQQSILEEEQRQARDEARDPTASPTYVLSATANSGAPFEGNEPKGFLPPHLWVRMSQGGAGLLSTSVHDLK